MQGPLFSYFHSRSQFVHNFIRINKLLFALSFLIFKFSRNKEWILLYGFIQWYFCCHKSFMSKCMKLLFSSINQIDRFLKTLSVKVKLVLFILVQIFLLKRILYYTRENIHDISWKVLLKSSSVFVVLFDGYSCCPKIHGWFEFCNNAWNFMSTKLPTF